MKLVKVKEATSSHAAVGGPDRKTALDSYEDLLRRLKVQAFIHDFTASFVHEQTSLIQLVQADVD